MNYEGKIINVCQNSKYLYIHEGIEENILNDMPNKEKKFIEYYLILPDVINKGYFKEKRSIKNGFVPVNNRKFIKTVSQKHAKKIKDFHLDHGNIICNGIYSKSDHKSLGYKISDYWNDKPLTKRPVSEKIAKKLKSDNHDKIDRQIIENLSQLKIDQRKTIQIITEEMIKENAKIDFSPNFTENEGFFNYNLSYNDKITFHQSNFLPSFQPLNLPYEYTFINFAEKKQKIDSWLIGLDMLKNEIYCSPDKYGRRHHNLTSFKRELKNGLYVPGLELIEIDIANSQPFLLNTILTHDTPDAREYLNLTSKGLLWDIFKDQCNYTGSKEDFKQDTFHAVFYSHPRSILGNNDVLLNIRNTFKRQFPGVYDQILKLKRNNYKYLSREMQRVESGLMIDNVCNQLMKDNRYFIPVHDSIITDKSNIEYVQHQIKMTFKNKYGLSPTIKADPL